MSTNLKCLGNLTRNTEFISQFEKHLKKFSLYKKDLRKIIDEAMHVRDDLVILNL